VKLHRSARHHEAAAGIAVGGIIGFRFRPEKRNAVVVFQHGGVLKREGIAIETELCYRCAATRQGDNCKRTEPNPY
jgi:hypothetical protein